MKQVNKNGILKMNLQFFADQDGTGNEPPVETPPKDIIEKEVNNIQESNGTAPKKEVVKEPQQPEGKVYTQAELNEMMAKEKQQGRNSVYNKYGLTEQQLEAVAAIFKQQEEAPPVDPNYDMQMKQRILRAEVGRELALVHVKPDTVDDMTTLAVSRIDDINNYDMERVREIVKDIKQKHTTSFEGQSEIQKQISGTGNNIGGTNVNVNAQKATNIGKRLAELNKQNSVVK